MNGIHLLLKSGPKIDDYLRKEIYFMAQYMLESKVGSLSFEIESKLVIANMSTDFKFGRHDSARGTIFWAKIEHEKNMLTDLLFLAEYCKDWRQHCNDNWEIITSNAIGGDPEQNWKN